MKYRAWESNFFSFVLQNQLYKKSNVWFFNNSLPNFRQDLRARTLPESSQMAEASGEMTVDLRRCSSEQNCYEIVNSGGFQLSPNERKSSSFLEGSSSNYQPINSNSSSSSARACLKNGRDSTNQAYESIKSILKNSGKSSLPADQSNLRAAHQQGQQNHASIKSSDSTSDETSLSNIVSQALDQTSHQASVQSLTQTLGKSLERNFEQSQKQPILFRTKELEKCREMENELTEFINDDCVRMIAKRRPSHTALQAKSSNVGAPLKEADYGRQCAGEPSRISAYPSAYCNQSTFPTDRTNYLNSNQIAHHRNTGQPTYDASNPAGRPVGCTAASGSTVVDAGASNYYGQTNQMNSISPFSQTNQTSSSYNQTTYNPAAYNQATYNQAAYNPFFDQYYNGSQHNNAYQPNSFYPTYNTAPPTSLSTNFNTNPNSSLNSGPYAQTMNVKQQVNHPVQQTPYQLNHLKVSPTADAAAYQTISPVNNPSVSPTSLMVSDLNGTTYQTTPSASPSSTYTLSPNLNYMNPFGQASNPFGSHANLSPTNLTTNNLTANPNLNPANPTNLTTNQSSSIGSKISQLIYSQGACLANYRAMLTGNSGSGKAQLAASYTQQNVPPCQPTTSCGSNGLRAANYLSMSCSGRRVSAEAQFYPTNQLANQPDRAINLNPFISVNELNHANQLTTASSVNPVNPPNQTGYFGGQSFSSALNMNSLIRSFCTPVRSRQTTLGNCRPASALDSYSSKPDNSLINHRTNSLVDNSKIANQANFY